MEAIKSLVGLAYKFEEGEEFDTARIRFNPGTFFMP